MTNENGTLGVRTAVLVLIAMALADLAMLAQAWPGTARGQAATNLTLTDRQSAVGSNAVADAGPGDPAFRVTDPKVEMFTGAGSFSDSTSSAASISNPDGRSAQATGTASHSSVVTADADGLTAQVSASMGGTAGITGSPSFAEGRGQSDFDVSFTLDAAANYTLEGSRTDPSFGDIFISFADLDLTGASFSHSGTLQPGSYHLDVSGVARATHSTFLTNVNESPDSGEYSLTLRVGDAVSERAVCADVTVGHAVAQGCFDETVPGSGVFETDQKAWVGGFEIQPRPGGKLVLDTLNPGVSEGGAGVDIVFRGRALPLPVSALPVGFAGGTIPFGQPGTLAFLFDVPVKGSVTVAWDAGGKESKFEAEIEINELTKGIGEPDPSTLGSGKLKARLVNGTGFKLEEFEVKIDEISVTPARMIVRRQLKLKNLLLKMELRPDAAMVEQPFWTGQAGITLPLTRGELDVTGRAFVFAGRLAGGGLEVDGLNKPIPDTPLFLQKVGGDLLFQPRFGFTLLIGGSLGPRVRGKLLMDIDGTMQGGELVSDCTAGRDPSKLEFTAKLTPLAVLEANGLAKADLTFRTCLYTGTVPAMELTGKAKIDFLGGVLGYEGSQTGFITTGGANLEGSVKLRIPALPDLNGQAIISTTGIAACADLTFFEGGFGYAFGGSQPPAAFSGCDLAPFRVTASAAALLARTAVATRVPAGLPHAAFAARSRTGAPRVKVTGPGGFKVTSPRGGRALRSRRVVIVPVKHENTTYVIVNDPRPGSWKVESVERGKPLTRVAFASGLDKPKVKVKLRKSGRRMVLTYTLRAMPGQKVTFSERGGGVARTIGRARGRKGKLTFTPTGGTPRRRTIQAEVTQNGLPRDLITVARFTAPR